MLGFHGLSVAPISALEDPLSNVTLTVNTAGTVAVDGQVLDLVVELELDTAGQLTIIGQDTLVLIALFPAAAEILVDGQSVNLRQGGGAARRALFTRGAGGARATYWIGRD